MIPIFSSHHSLLRSILTLEEPFEIVDNSSTSIFSICQKHQIKDLFLCENSSYSGFIEAYKTAEKEKINLHFGQKLVCCEDIEKKDEESLQTEHKITIWALSTEGCKLLQKIYSKASIDGFYYQARIDFKTLKQYWNNEHLLLIIPFYDSFIFNNLMFFNTAIIPNFGEIKPIFHIENHDLPFDALVKNAVESYCKINNYETLETHSVYYYNRNDFTAYNVFRCIENRTTLSKPNLEYFSSTEFSFESFLEKQNLNNNIKFLNKFKKYKFPNLGYVKIPSIEISEKQKEKVGANLNCTNFEFLKHLCYKGFEEKLVSGKIDKTKHQEYIDRCQLELNTFEELGFVDYVLIIYDIIDFAIKNDIPRSYGRGSVCGSLVFYLIGATNIDPLPFELYFQRFISKARTKKKVINGEIWADGKLIPDVDNDFCYFRKDEIFNYIQNKYKGKVSKIVNLHTLQTKTLIKECGKIIEELSEDEVKSISDLIPVLYGKPEEIEKASNEIKDLKRFLDKYPLIYSVAKKIYNLIKNKSQHASAVIITSENIEDSLPLELSSSKDIVAGYDMYSSQEIALKVDILGLKTTSILFETCKMIGLNPFELDLNHKSIYEFLQNFENAYGIFQLETFAQGKCVKKIKPKNLWELSCSLAISRPGASSFLDQFCDYVHNGIKVKINTLIDDVLEKTGGVCLFQEQVLKMLNNLGMDLENCEAVRKAIGKKDRYAIKESKQKIYDICSKNNHPIELADLIWKIVNDSSGYQFCLSHSLAYASLSAATIYLKINYPKEFYLSLLNMTKNEQNYVKILSCINFELKKNSLSLLPPHILRSNIEFKVENNGIRFGLGAIKGISDKAIEKLQNFKTKYSNKFDIFSAANEARIPINIMFSLIMAGSMDDMLTETRSKTVLELVLWNLLINKKKDCPISLKLKKYCFLLGAEFNFNLINIIKYLNKEKKDEKGKPVIKDSRLETIRKHFRPYHEMYKNNLKYESIYQYIMEKELIGFNYNSDLYSIFKKEIPELLSINEIKNLMDGEYVRVSGEIISNVEKRKSKEKKTPYIKFTINDGTDSIDCLAFNSNNNPIIDQIEENNARLPVESDLCIIYATKQNDVLFVKRLGIQDIKIIKKISEIELEPKTEIKSRN